MSKRGEKANWKRQKRREREIASRADWAERRQVIGVKRGENRKTLKSGERLRSLRWSHLAEFLEMQLACELLPTDYQQNILLYYRVLTD